MSLDLTLRRDLYDLKPLDFNITHNLVPMAQEVDLYRCLWRPEEHYSNPVLARDIAPDVRAGLIRLIKEGSNGEFAHLEPWNGWGTYTDFVRFVFDVNRALWQWPLATVEACR